MIGPCDLPTCARASAMRILDCSRTVRSLPSSGTRWSVASAPGPSGPVGSVSQADAPDRLRAMASRADERVFLRIDVSPLVRLWTGKVEAGVRNARMDPLFRADVLR